MDGNYWTNSCVRRVCDWSVLRMNEQKEIVTCKDCTFCYIKDMTIGTCDNRWGMNGTVRPDDYCSRGRKRDADQSTEAR